MIKIEKLIEELKNVAVRCDLDDDYDLNDCAEDVREIANNLEKAVTNCNQFKMREALIAMLDEKCKQCYINDQICTQGLECHWNGKRGEICQDEAIDKAIAALSAPPRNCDKIHDVHEMSIAESPLDMSLVVAPREELLRFIYWLFDEAKGDAK